jgi:hypothetical protein
MGHLLAECALGRILEENDFKSQYMTWGEEHEDEAFAAYEFEEKRETEPGGFVTDDAGRFGCSPDRLDGKNALCEFKCGVASTHMFYLLDPAGIVKDYRPQLQGQLLVCDDRDTVYAVSYHPEMPQQIVVVPVHREEPYQKILRQLLTQFCDQLDAMKEKLQAKWGPFPAPKGVIKEPALADDDEGALGVSMDDFDLLVEARERGTLS